MSSQPNFSDGLRISAVTGTERAGRDGRKRSAKDIDEQIEAGFRRVFETSSVDRPEMHLGDSRVLRARKSPRRPLNGTPPLPELE